MSQSLPPRTGSPGTFREERRPSETTKPLPENPSSDQIKRRIDRTRGEMDETIDELGERLNPRHLLDEVIEVFRGPEAQDRIRRVGGVANEFVGTLGRQIRDNPIPTLLVGTGLAWLAFAHGDSGATRQDVRTGRRPSRSSSGIWEPEDLEWEDDRRVGFEEYNYEDEDFGDVEEIMIHDVEFSDGPRELPIQETELSATGMDMREGTSVTSSIGKAASDAASSAREAASSAKESVSGAAASIKSAVSHAGETVAQVAGQGYRDTRRGAQSAYRGLARGASRGTARASRTARRAYRSSSEQLEHLYTATSERVRDAHQDYPLGVGLGCLALGALVGLAIPRTRREDEWMGESSDHLVDEAKKAGEEMVERGKQAVGHTVETVKKSADKHGLSAAGLGERVSHVVSEALSTATETAEEEGLSPSQLRADIGKVAKETEADAKREVEAATNKLPTGAAKPSTAQSKGEPTARKSKL